jgi:hypothetical protein
LDPGEECDCGTDPDNLPAGCLGVNGEAGCGQDCTLRQYCGDGVVDADEECDCGQDPTNLPQGCSAANGGPECTVDCTVPTQCLHALWEECDPAGQFECCPDPWGADTECATDLTTPYCLLPCDDTADCYLNNYCGADGHCMPAYCGPGFPAGGQLNGACAVPGGGSGVCVPLEAASYGLGICVESGAGAQGAACDPPATLEVSSQPRSESWDGCGAGICKADGLCRNVCDWQAAYSGNDGCPAATNCVALSYFYAQDPADPYDDDFDGRRWNDRGLCWPQALDPQDGYYTCDLVSQTVLVGGGSCADVQTDWWCLPVELDNGRLGLGTPVGVCRTPTLPADPVYKEVWDVCDPQADDVCPAGSQCLQDPNSDVRCLPYCDVQNDDCAGRPGLPADVTCVSLSDWFAPDDPAPSRLGVCVCPAGGCI